MLKPEHRAALRTVLADAEGIAWDTCHKIYILMDAPQMEQMAEWGYDPLLAVDDVEWALETLEKWWDNSCDLRFIQAVSTVDGDPNDGFDSIIPQFAYDASVW